MSPEATPLEILEARFPTKGRRPAGELAELERIWRRPSGWGWITAINNNFVGVYYVGAAMLFFVLAGALAVLMRTQLALPLNGFLPQETYNQFLTGHGTMMMFLFDLPGNAGLGRTMIRPPDRPLPT